MATQKQIKAAYEELIANEVFVNHEEVERALEAAEAAAWEPIETALKDGDTNMLIGCFGEVGYGEQFVAFYNDHPDRPTHPWQTPDGVAYARDLPTHWRPLPAAPIAADADPKSQKSW